MGDVVKDFYKSDAPQFKGKSKAKRRQMAIAAKLSKMDEKEKADKPEDLLKGFDPKTARALMMLKQNIHKRIMCYRLYWLMLRKMKKTVT